jgi:hypothetical protein
MTSPKGRCDAERDFSKIEILDDLIVGEPGCPTMLVMQHNTNMVGSSMLKNKIDEKAKLIPAGQHGAGFA